MNKKINCDPKVYNPATKTCIEVYCHSNGRGEYSPIRWDNNMSRLGCSDCHDAPPQDEKHKEAKLESCGQKKCHLDTIHNGYTTIKHINGIIEGENRSEEDDQCLTCHEDTQGKRPAIGPFFKMQSKHTGGPPTDHDCIVCHMEGKEEYHQNGQV